MRLSGTSEWRGYKRRVPIRTRWTIKGEDDGCSPSLYRMSPLSLSQSTQLRAFALLAIFFGPEWPTRKMKRWTKCLLVIALPATYGQWRNPNRWGVNDKQVGNQGDASNRTSKLIQAIFYVRVFVHYLKPVFSLVKVIGLFPPPIAFHGRRYIKKTKNKNYLRAIYGWPCCWQTNLSLAIGWFRPFPL